MNKLAALFGLLLAGAAASAQSGGTDSGFSPYSVYGIGDLHAQGSAWNRTVGGAGIATRNHRFVNVLNPAAVTARDSLAFMADVGLSGRMSLYSEGTAQSANYLVNINDFVLSFPIYRQSAFMVGIRPFSDVGYRLSYHDMSTSGPGNIAYTGNRTYTSAGTGSIYELFIAGGVTLWNRLSLGAEYIHYFGSLNKETSVEFTTTSFRSMFQGDTLQLRGSTAKFGLQYEQPLSRNLTLSFGATYRLKARMKGSAMDYTYGVISSDSQSLSGTTRDLAGKISFGDEIGIGLGLRHTDKWALAADYVRSDWRSSGFDDLKGFANRGASVFSAGVAQSFRGGFEITPNRNDIRYYFKQCTYRFGGYLEQSYYQVDGKNVNTAALTLGITLPVYRWYNGITIGIELGQRGLGLPVKENFAAFSIGFNLFDIWFQKPRYQ